jgi:hypothetical protein
MGELKTDFEFTLPTGYVDEDGALHRDGVMRLAKAIDEVAPFEDARAGVNEAYISVLLISRVLSRLGTISPVPPSVVERLFASDFAFLQEIYIRLNEHGNRFVETACPSCGRRFGLDLAMLAAPSRAGSG